MTQRTRGKKRALAGFLLGAVLAPLAVCLFSTMMLPAEAQAVGSAWASSLHPVTPAMAEVFGSVGLAALVQSLLGGALGMVAAVSTLPFADDGKTLVARSLAHFGATAALFSALIWVCRWLDDPRFIPLWVALLAILYAVIWLARWTGWYVEVMQLRELLGLDPGPTPLKWRETVPYLPFVFLVCDLLPLALRWVDRTFVVDVPVLSGLILPYFLLPVAGFCSGVSLGKRQGVCPLYPLACFVCYLPMVWLLFNSSALFHCFMVAVPALMGNLLGWLYRRAVPKDLSP